MEKDIYKLLDWHRIFIGAVPGSFYIEVIIRTVIIYFILILAIRLMGKRMALQLNVTEMAAMVTLAAAIGVPIQAPDKGILPAVVIALVVVICERLLSKRAFGHEKFEQLIHGDIYFLVVDSTINVDCLIPAGMSQALIFEQVRAHGVPHLGHVKRLYMESSGAFSLVLDEDVKPGLSVMPEDDLDYWKDENRQAEIYVCAFCGHTGNPGNAADVKCTVCDHQIWVPAITDKKA
ncbi:hypothetical protein SAMN06265348_102149 [Pedobacter westerhofensis]|uniref:YetF C-terminal domain-containing protein n=1 Tax=Pedobacter westerhofensis TaxID=425512 RepID=A0A521BB02_9SPHI|nr:YetF domain-containing protein [Pedobacter westerhofensis]SMO44249.1 hypothetical protein SAMN06265348_102149 [Pedobacter westerhofensis]